METEMGLLGEGRWVEGSWVWVELCPCVCVWAVTCVLCVCVCVCGYVLLL